MRHIFMAALFFTTLSIDAYEIVDESSDTMGVSLDSLVVTSHRYTSRLRTRDFGEVKWDMTMMEDLPKILGNADPVHYAQMLPGVQTNGELRSGLNIQGCDNAHTMFSIQGVPLYNVSHLLGIFSAFNASHYPSMSLEKTPLKGASPSRIGGHLNMLLPDVIPDSVNGIMSVGIISSQGTLRIPIKKKTLLTLSARGSYLNLLYGSLLKVDEGQMEYSFFDINATLLHEINKRNRFILDFYMGRDNARITDEDNYSDYRTKWGNHEVAMHWLHTCDNGWSMKNTIYNTRYFNQFDMEMEDMSISLPSSIMDFGYKGEFKWNNLSFGLDFTHHIIQPQDPYVESSFNIASQPQDVVNSQEVSLWADYKYFFNRYLSLSSGLRYTFYHAYDECYNALDPSLAFSWRPNDIMSFSAGYAMRHQNVFQVGFSSVGLPTEFWLPAGGPAGKPQWGHGPTVSFAFSLWNGRYRLSLDAYYKRLYNQIEYSGTPYDFVNSVYDLYKSLLHGDGKNYGVNVMFAKCTGKLTGWISYSWGRALRMYDYPQLSGTFPANHERIHELNVVSTWRVGKRWTLGATYVMASGTPFTAPRSFYVINGKIFSQFGEHNANRLPLYSRLDVSVNVRLGKLSRHWQHFLNVSVYNATGRYNPLHYHLKIYKGKFSYRPLYMSFPIIPSISYTMKF